MSPVPRRRVESHEKSSGPEMASHEDGRPGHSGVVRLTHWLTAVAFVALVVSGYVITMTHPRLYWGNVGNIYMPAWIQLPIERKLGESGWGRSLHFLSAWILVLTGMIYVVWGFLAHHFTRDLLPRRAELESRAHASGNHEPAPLAYPQGRPGSLRAVAKKHLPDRRLRARSAGGAHRVGAFSSRHRRLSTAASDIRRHQSARTIHFLDSVVLLLFLIVHVIMVVRSGFGRRSER